jgi:hypothetical protein
LDALQHYLQPIALALRLRLDSFRREGPVMHNSKVAIICYAVAVGFILAVAFHSPARMLITADVPAAASSAK